LKTDADIIGINNRNLDTLEINLETTKQILENSQKSKIILSESGIKSTNDIKFLRDCGADAFLIGTSIMKSSDIQNSVSELVKAI
jgi:indole-3-glycerol phosphate synthase